MFDLDGTLLDTLDDIAAAGNQMLQTLGLATIRRDRYRYLAGQGAASLVREAIGTGHEWMWPRGQELFKRFLHEHAHARTEPYPGVPEMLDALVARGVKLAVLSNKPDAATREVVAQKLDRWPFAAVRGHRDDAPLKPDPTSARAVIAELAIEPDRWLYVGDTRVDMETAAAADLFPVGVLWGFRDEAELRDSGARALIAQPADLLPLVGAG